MTIDGLLTRAAARASEGTAVIDRGREITYGELDRASSRLANALREHHVRPGDRVGLLLEKSLEAVIAVYAILKAGAVYVPLDNQAPVARLAYIASNADIRCLISTPAMASTWPKLIEQGVPLETIVLAGDAGPAAPGVTVLPWEALAGYPAAQPERAGDPDALAYILYTSGSTGEPKGVMLSHANCLGFVEWAAQEVGVGAADRLSSHAPLHFDLSTFDLFAAAWGGAPVVLVPRESSVFPIELAKFIREQRITVWYSVPSILTQLVLHGDFDTQPPAELRAVIFAGEVFPVKYLGRLRELLPGTRLINFFGPTETNVCTSYEVSPTEPLTRDLPIGQPIAGVSATVRDPESGSQRDDGPGELYISGPTVMHGYWGDPERTARTLSIENGQRVYRTGDLVQPRADGGLDFLGRRDAQVKTRGYRVELGEIEAVLNALDAVIECAVVAVPDELITNRLRAFVVARDGVASGELAAACGSRLPRYMIPSEFELRQALPKSSTGKIDRQRLLEAGSEGGA